MGQVIWFSISCQQEFHFIWYWYHCKWTYIMSFNCNIKISQFWPWPNCTFLMWWYTYVMSSSKIGPMLGILVLRYSQIKKTVLLIPVVFEHTYIFFEIIWQTGRELSAIGNILGTTLKYTIQRFDPFCFTASHIWQKMSMGKIKKKKATTTAKTNIHKHTHPHIKTKDRTKKKLGKENKTRFSSPFSCTHNLNVYPRSNISTGCSHWHPGSTHE